jgi:hypothetical protein
MVYIRNAIAQHRGAGELRRIPIPRTPLNKGKKVNKGKKEDRSCYCAPALYKLAVFGSTRPYEGVDVYPR